MMISGTAPRQPAPGQPVPPGPGRPGSVPSGPVRPGLGASGVLTACGLLLALGLAPTAVAYVLYYRGLRFQPASTAALLSLLEPLTAAVLAAIFLGERLSVTGIIGAVILLAAVARAAVAGPARGQKA